MRYENILYPIFVVLIAVTGCHESGKTVSKEIKKEFGVRKPDAKAESRFADMRFGVMMHWGPGVLHKKEISWRMPEIGGRKKYEAIYPNFNPQKFNADEWASLVDLAGGKYAVYVTKHHDGFCMWDTKTTDINVMNTPFKVDVTGEFAKACRQKGLAYGTYLSIMDVHEAKWEQVYGSQEDMPGYPEGIPHILNFTTRQCLELVRQYDPDIMWFDGQWLEGWNKDIAANLYDRLKEEKPELLITRIQSRPPLGSDGSWDYKNNVGDYHSMEFKIGGYMKTPWEVVTSIGIHNYSYNDQMTYFTPGKMIEKLTRVWCGNGNFLLGFVPDFDGAIPEVQKEIAKEIGDWIRANSEAVYGTRGGPWYPTQWGGSTCKGKNVYVYALPDAPQVIRLSASTAKVLNARVLSTGTSVEFDQDEEGLNLILPESIRDPKATVIRLTMDKEINGMLDHRKERSIFADNTYGGIISRDATLTLGSRDEHDNDSEHELLFKDTQGSLDYAFHTKYESNPWVIVDLGEIKKVTGFAIENRNILSHFAKTLHVSISTDRENWEQVWKAEEGLPRWEVPLTDFHDAGGKLPGELTRYIKLETKNHVPAPLHLRKVEIYGHEMEHE